MKTLTETFDVAVCGGGLAGFCAAVAAARHGAKTVLIQDRPVFGGNSSSEVRVPPHGAAAFHAYARETGIISELLIAERAANHQEIFENGCINSVYDMTLYDLAVRTPNLTFHMNTSVFDVVMADGSHGVQILPEVKAGYAHRPACSTSRELRAVLARVANAETILKIEAARFVDCTGDGLIADLCGCEWRMGSEGREEFDEPHAPAAPSADTMGNSIHFMARDRGCPVPFQAPDWAVKHEDAGFFYNQGRVPYDVRGGFWWIEIGVPWDTIYGAEDIRHELTRHTLGVWDWIKNRDPKTMQKAANYALDWIGQVPGKRESRRIIGRYFMTEHDPAGKTVFEDEIAFGGWFIDLHTPGGLLAPTSEAASAEGYSETSEYAQKSYAGPYGIPLRCLRSKDIDNLGFAGRNVSVTHAALGTVRVMATTALMGQALGTALALELKGEQSVSALQQTLLRDGCFLPNVANQDPADLARSARVEASSEAVLYGIGPESLSVTGRPGHWGDRKRGEMKNIPHRTGQLIALGSKDLKSISLCLGNKGEHDLAVEARLVVLDHIWDYRAEGSGTLASGTLTIPPGDLHWIEWPIELTGAPAGKFVRVDLLPHPDLVWHASPALEPGHSAMFEMGNSKMRRLNGTPALSFRVEPPQPCYAAANVLSGETRPHRFTNLWRSDPRQPLPQWLQLSWPEPVTFQTVELTFPGHLLREYHAYPPFFRDPQTARDYTIEAWQDGAWRVLHNEKGNYQRHRRHILTDAVTTSRLRVVVHATNGDPSAAIYEIRAYS